MISRNRWRLVDVVLIVLWVMLLSSFIQMLVKTAPPKEITEVKQAPVVIELTQAEVFWNQHQEDLIRQFNH